MVMRVSHNLNLLAGYYYYFFRVDYNYYFFRVDYYYFFGEWIIIISTYSCAVHIDISDQIY